MTHDKTKLTQLGRDSYRYHGMVNTPIFQTSTVLFETLEDYHEAEQGKAKYYNATEYKSTDYGYGIAGTCTTFSLQQTILELEKGDVCVITPSGLSAITTALYALVKQGDEILMVDTAYGPARRFCNKTLAKFGVKTTYYDPTIGAGIEKLITPQTKVIWLESPGSLTFEMQDIDAIVAVSKKHNIITVCDNSWGAPLFFHPLEHGVDISVIALTKYYSGHSDAIMGAVVCNEATSKAVQSTFQNLGLYVSPFEVSQVLRGMRSVVVRLEAQQQSALYIAQALEKHPLVKRVLYPALPSDPGHELWKKYCTGAASMFSLVLHKKYSEGELAKMINGLAHFGIGVSWGGYESLIIDFEPKAIRTATKWADEGTCLRLYIGLEDKDDLLKDLEAGFSRLPK